MVWASAINAKVRAMKSRREFSQQTNPIHPIGPYAHVLVCCIVFGCIWGRFKTAWNSMHNSVNWCNQCTSSCHEVTSEIFVTNTTSPLHWTLHSCVGALHSVWVHLLSFRNCMKLDAKRGELVQLKQKFMPQSHVGIFRNERTQSNTLDPKLMFW